MLSENTQAALDAFKASPPPPKPPRPLFSRREPGSTLAGSRAAVKSVRSKVNAAYAEVTPIIQELRQEGMPLHTIAEVLNSTGRLTRRGKPWSKVQVKRVLEFAER